MDKHLQEKTVHRSNTTDEPVIPAEIDDCESDTKIYPSAYGDQHDVVFSAELNRRIDILKHRSDSNDNTIRSKAKQWIYDDMGDDLISRIEPKTYRVWYSRKTEGGDFIEVLIRTEGTIYHWPATHKWLASVIRRQHDSECQCIGTFVETDRELTETE